MASIGPETATILVVDDTLESLKFVAAALEAAGMTVLVAGDGAAALQSLALQRPDLVIMDAMMPVLDGFETTRRIKADPRLATLPVIFMTGLTETEHVLRGLAAGGVDYVTKPVIIDELLARVRVHLGNARVSQGSQAVLDDSGRSLLAIDSAGRLLWSTPRTRSILERHFAGPEAQAALAAALLRLADGDDQGVWARMVSDGRLEFTLINRSGRDEWLFRISEIAAGSEERLLAARHGLTDREAEVLLWISRGKANIEISEILGISPRTVNKHLEQVFEKMGIENRASAAAAAVKTLSQ
jgi:DNA-binding response OmpR family regulator/DNA-binding CsgD family transcriptional regulator